MTAERGDVTRLLVACREGQPGALEDLVPVVYGQLRRMARARLRGERRDHTLTATALVHEAYLELVKLEQPGWQDRSHFFAVAARVMRNILVDHAVRRKAQKRDGGRERLELDQVWLGTEERREEILALDEALRALEALDERQARVVECRVFTGLSIEETSAALGISEASVSRDWKTARAWLNRELGGTT